MTLVEHAAARRARLWASARRFRERRQDARARLGHARGRLPVATRPNFGAGGSATSPARIAMRSSMPRGASVQRATQSMKSRNARAQRRPVEDLGDGFQIVAAGGARGPDDAGRDARAERHAHEGAGLELEAGGAR